MSEHDNLAVIRAWVDAINRNDVAAELACWRPDGEFVVVPTGVSYRGVDQMRPGWPKVRRGGGWPTRTGP